MNMNSFKSSCLSDTSVTKIGMPKFLKMVNEQKVVCMNMERYENDECNKITEGNDQRSSESEGLNMEETKGTNNLRESISNRINIILDCFGEMDSHINDFRQQMRLINNEMSSL
jgi:hypothetical protein